MFSFGAKKREKANINENIETCTENLETYTANCNFYHNSNFSSKTLFLTNSFADSETVELLCLCFAPNRGKKQTLTKTLRPQILASCTGNCNLNHKSNFSSRTLILTNSFAESELDGLVCLRFVRKIKKKRTLTKTLRFERKILASYTANCNFHHKSNFSSNPLILTKCFADSELVGLV